MSQLRFHHLLLFRHARRPPSFPFSHVNKTTPLLFFFGSTLRSGTMAAYNTIAEAPKLLFRQLFEKESCTYTYLLADVGHPNKPAVLVDPVDKTVDRDLTLVKDLGLKLLYAMNTHAHADHVTGTGIIKGKMSGVKSVISKASSAKADHLVEHGDKIYFGNLFLEGNSMHSAKAISRVII